ncbi:glutamate-rich WD repeat-containing protein 1 [Heterostelium album PN500]|uniref:Glutamate-rich WD repeat-containing protein 1 n=1 Tax=Heterostelium pallidum (strain ATCC 26659 / Pp 5 / PN500) TaxID=670386 RepID=D3B5L4_HETP5|nr:glutamate-rich WD repeat-containing protein 1 [Heterostelium album PN500]EFA83162.1 glutamate-rich WD repeat-containing protein 1 [Heterostelium album PN500]|eukprot:XP_020435279.1 glutamate-rich WD repeat-containing protein 1 [Heterostelium album PN500]
MSKRERDDDIEFDDDQEENDQIEEEQDEEEDYHEMNDEDEEENNDQEIEQEDEEEDEDDRSNLRVWRPGVDAMDEDEELIYDSSAYDMMHTMTVEWPCLSFQPLRDNLGLNRSKYPHTMYMVAGTQADQAKNNKILVMKVSSLCKTKHDEDDSDAESSDEEDDEDEDFDKEVDLQTNFINHNGAVNRIRAMEQQPNIVATWSDSRQVFIWNIHNNLKELDGENKQLKNQSSPIHVVTSHSDEGYALDWSPTTVGRLASGDCSNMIYVTNAAGATWKTDTAPYKGHEASVEDIQWSPSEVNVFASCSSDQTIKVWDIRSRKPAISVHAHESDVNVISWSRKVGYLMVSGGDDGSFRVWDLRNFKNDSPVSNFTYHNGPISSLQWNPFDESQVIVASNDNQVTVWDFSLEEDTEEFEGTEETDDYQVPPQLFFIHQGQHDVKEVHWHPQIPHVAITTAYEGFNIFKSSNSE